MRFIKRTRKIGRRYFAQYYCLICHSIVERRMDSGPKLISCGCIKKQGLTAHPAYSTWEGMLQRCHNPNHKMYKWYGAKGITVCNTWRNNSKAFLDWADSTGYTKGLTIDRINNEVGYTPENCQWLTLLDNLNKDRDKRKSTSKVTKDIYDSIYRLHKEGNTSIEIGEIVGLSPRYIRQLLAKEFIPKSVGPSWAACKEYPLC